MKASENRTEIFCRAHVPRGLEQAWLQHLRDFSIAHPGCHFDVAIEDSGIPVNRENVVMGLTHNARVFPIDLAISFAIGQWACDCGRLNPENCQEDPCRFPDFRR
jgi:hypothetical protein